MVVESDKADMDVESFEEGYLAAVLTEEGDSAKVGAAVALIVERYVYRYRYRYRGKQR